jgi:hypothetical protein
MGKRAEAKLRQEFITSVLVAIRARDGIAVAMAAAETWIIALAGILARETGQAHARRVLDVAGKVLPAKAAMSGPITHLPTERAALIFRDHQPASSAIFRSGNA